MGMSFLSTLTFDSLQRVRRLVKQVHLEHYPADKITDREADRVIEALGPVALQQEIEDAARARLDMT